MSSTAPVFFLADGGEHNPFHLFFYMISQFKYLDDGSSVIEYYYPNKNNCYLSESALSNLPSRFKRELELRKSGSYIRNTVELITGINKSDEQWIYSYIRDLYKDIWSSIKQVKGTYTYISRSKATCRRILNEPAFIDELSRLNVRVVHMEDLKFEDQIKVFRESELITGPHGAAFSFGIFCEPGAILYEIYPAVRDKSHYNTLSTNCKLNYKRFINILKFNCETSDMRIDSDSYIESLKTIIEVIKD